MSEETERSAFLASLRRLGSNYSLAGLMQCYMAATLPEDKAEVTSILVGTLRGLSRNGILGDVPQLEADVVRVLDLQQPEKKLIDAVLKASAKRPALFRQVLEKIHERGLDGQQEVKNRIHFTLGKKLKTLIDAKNVERTVSLLPNLLDLGFEDLFARSMRFVCQRLSKDSVLRALEGRIDDEKKAKITEAYEKYGMLGTQSGKSPVEVACEYLRRNAAREQPRRTGKVAVMGAS